MSTEEVPQDQVQPQPAQPQQVRAYGNGRRAFYGLLWSFYTVVLVVAFISLAATGNALGAIISLAVAGVTGHYAWKIWTWRAKRLIFLIFF